MIKLSRDSMDKIIKNVLEKITKNGYEAFIVGGYVRDALRGINSYDVDICTNALPKDIHNIFNINNYNGYGGSNLKIGKYNIDITTYREELNYENRKPSSLVYIDSLEKDLLRRDFTINSICMDKDEHVIDKLKGIEDLNKNLIRVIGDIDKKLKEDPLRILRAIRFATILDFKLEPNLEAYIKENASLIKTLSKERIKKEYDKILLSPNFQKGLDLLEKLGINKILNISYDHITYTSSIMGMYAQLNFRDMPFTKQEKKTIIKITEVIKKGYIDNEVLYHNDLYISSVAAQILGISSKEINKLYKKLPIKERKDLNIKSNDIVHILNCEDKVINKVYLDLEKNILNNKLKNNNKEIRKYLESNKGKW